MLNKRLIACLDVRDGKVTKGVNFLGNKDIGDPISLGESYYKEGIDELVFYDITASRENRSIDLDMVSQVARKIFIPFSVGGGIRTVQDIRNVLLAGAEKVSVNSLAVKEPSLISEGAKLFGSQCIVLGVDVKRNTAFPSGYQVFIKGGSEATELDALDWISNAEKLGAGEVCLNSIDADGTKEGYDIPLIKKVSQVCSIPVIASGGGGEPKHLAEVFEKSEAEAVLVASMLHYKTYDIQTLKKFLKDRGILVR